MEWEREEWIREYESGERIAEMARRYGISRKALYKWIQRFEQSGVEGLSDLSRAPLAHPQAVGEIWRERIAGARRERPGWGAQKLEWLLEQRYSEGVPSASSIGRILKELGLSRRRRRISRAQGTGGLYAAQAPNEVWSIDFKGWCRTGDGQRCEPLTVSDQATRFLLCCQGMSRTGSEVVRPVLERVFREYGLPERMRSDNGAPFASCGECGLTELAVWWIELGIECERIDPGHPQQNGRHERMHRTLKEAAMSPPASTLRQQQRRFDRFRQEFNFERPHEALGQRVPAELYQAARRGYPDKIAEPEYATGWDVRKVSNGGQMRWQARRLFVSHALEGKLVGVEPLEEDVGKLWFYRQWLGVLDLRAAKLWRPRQWMRQQNRFPSP
jgi:transposase InsO family protein